MRPVFLKVRSTEYRELNYNGKTPQVKRLHEHFKKAGIAKWCKLQHDTPASNHRLKISIKQVKVFKIKKDHVLHITMENVPEKHRFDQNVSVTMCF